jgi:glycosyltransferase involved in cell wall biosynthesis
VGQGAVEEASREWRKMGMSSHARSIRDAGGSNPRVSVVVPVYNVEDYIGPMIESIGLQSFRDFEVVLVDDGSTDASMSIASSMLQREGIVFRTVTQPNSGMAAARNAGLLEAVGEFIVFIDSDDVLHGDFLQLLTPPTGHEIAEPIFAGYRSVTPNECSVFPSLRPTAESLDSAAVRELFLSRKMPIIAPGILCGRTFLLENKLMFNPEMRFSEDQEWIWRLLFTVESIKVIDAVTYNYVRRPHSIMTSSTLLSIESGFRGFQNLAESDVLRNSDATPSGHEILARWVVGTAHSSAHILDEDDYKALLSKIDYRRHAREIDPGKDIRLNLIRLGARLPSLALYRFYRKFG